MSITKQELVTLFEEELAAWDTLLAGLSTEQLTEPWLPDGLSVKDTLAHLRAWQQRTSARVEAGLHGHAPRYADWPVEVSEEETIEQVDRANAWVLETNRSRPWNDVHREWREGFLRFLELVREIPEEGMLPGGRFEWIADFEPSEILPGSYDHHHSEHRGLLMAWLRGRQTGESVG